MVRRKVYAPSPPGLLAAFSTAGGRSSGVLLGRDGAAPFEARVVVRVRDVDRHLQDLADLDEVGVRDIVELGDVADT